MAGVDGLRAPGGVCAEPGALRAIAKGAEWTRASSAGTYMCPCPSPTLLQLFWQQAASGGIFAMRMAPLVGLRRPQPPRNRLPSPADLSPAVSLMTWVLPCAEGLQPGHAVAARGRGGIGGVGGARRAWHPGAALPHARGRLQGAPMQTWPVKDSSKLCLWLVSIRTRAPTNALSLTELSLRVLDSTECICCVRVAEASLHVTVGG